jgi:hypothetical protein
MMNLILIVILVAILVVIAIGFSSYNIEPVNGDDSQSDLGLCLQGYQSVCDKLDIEKINSEMLKIAGGQTQCFNDVNDFFQEKMKHINDTDFTIVYPCPEFNRSQVPEDESGK